MRENAIITHQNLNTKEYFFSTSHMQDTICDDWVPHTYCIPNNVTPRPCCPDGIVKTKEDYIAVFCDDLKEIPNPDNWYQVRSPELNRQIDLQMAEYFGMSIYELEEVPPVYIEEYRTIFCQIDVGLMVLREHLGFDSSDDTQEFTLYWLDGKREVVVGYGLKDAMTRAGIGGGALRALDFHATGNDTDYIWNKEIRNWDRDKSGDEEKKAKWVAIQKNKEGCGPVLVKIDPKEIS